MTEKSDGSSFCAGKEMHPAPFRFSGIQEIKIFTV